MDFFKVSRKEDKQGVPILYPDFLVGRSKDLMIKGNAFYAIWDEKKNLWSTDEYDVQRLVDEKLYLEASKTSEPQTVHYLSSFKNNTWAEFQRYTRNLSDNAHTLDNQLIFSDTEVTKESYATKRLPYPLAPGDYDSWDRLLSVLYSPEERAKIEWAIGSIIEGDSKHIQKFLVFYGPAGSGKSTVLNIIQKLFAGYSVMFDAKALGSNNNQFSLEAFKGNPLVAIQHDGDLSRIEDNTKLNSIISHEEMVVNEKFKSSYTARFNAFLFMGTNQPVKISDAKSGLIRRLIDVEPTGRKLEYDDYQDIMSSIDFQLGAIAYHCHQTYLEMGKNYYDDYRPLEMMYKTDHVLNFVSDQFDIFAKQEYTTVKQAYTMYKEFCDDFGIDRPMSRQRFQSEVDNYFDEYHDTYISAEGVKVRNVFTGFNINKYQPLKFNKHKTSKGIELKEQESIFDKEMSECFAQLATDQGTPRKRWIDVKETLSDIDTSELHYVRVPKNHIVIDFDIVDENGDKDLDANLEAASKWPSTYTEVSKSGNGVHLHYIYDGDVDVLDNLYEDGIEIKVFRGNSSLRRKLSLCNDKDISVISSGLPIKEKKVSTAHEVKSEKGLRTLIDKNLRKEIHPGTKPSVMFIKKILDDAYDSGLEYDVSDLRPSVIVFANRSTNHANDMLRLVTKMKFKGMDIPNGNEMTTEPSPDIQKKETSNENDNIAFFDVEVYPNLFLVVWKYDGSDQHVVMMNPKPEQIEELFKLKLVGFNNRKYDNHILYGRYMGMSNEDLYELSQKIVNNDRNALFAGAYGISYTDIYDFSSKKQGLKKFEIELGINHMEMEIPWDEPVPDDMISKVIDYCKNDVDATEAVFHARKGDFLARQILADLSGLSVNDSTNAHTTKIVFRENQNPAKDLVYTDLSTGRRSDGKELPDLRSTSEFESYLKGQ